jgi:serine/threonine protein kinase
MLNSLIIKDECTSIYINNYEFKHIYNYILKKLSTILGTTGYVDVCNLIRVNSSENEIVKKVILKKFNEEYYYYLEKNLVIKITRLLQSRSINFYHKIIFYDDINFILIYDYFGKTLNKEYDIKNLNYINKITIFKDIIDWCIVLHESGIIHNDIKPDNICIDDNKGILVDYGISYIINNYNKGIEFNTTLWSASPEYLQIALYLENKIQLNADIENMFNKSQHYALAGLIIGLLTNDIYIFYKTIYKYIYSNQEDNMKIRFNKYNKSNLDKIKRNIDNITKLIRENNQYVSEEIIEIINNMLEYEYDKRISLEEISLKLEKIIKDIS